MPVKWQLDRTCLGYSANQPSRSSLGEASAEGMCSHSMALRGSEQQEQWNTHSKAAGPTRDSHVTRQDQQERWRKGTIMSYLVFINILTVLDKIKQVKVATGNHRSPSGSVQRTVHKQSVEAANTARGAGLGASTCGCSAP